MSRGFARNLGAPPRPPRPVYSTTMKAQLERRLALVCAELGCLAIEARAMWAGAGAELIIGEAEAGSTEAEVQVLKRHPRRGVRP